MEGEKEKKGKKMVKGETLRVTLEYGGIFQSQRETEESNGHPHSSWQLYLIISLHGLVD